MPAGEDDRIVPDSPQKRHAARAAGERRVQNVTLWTVAGSVAAAVVLSVLFAQGAGAVPGSSTPSTGSPTTTDQGGTGSTGQGSQNQLQAPDVLPGGSSGGRLHGASGGS